MHPPPALIVLDNYCAADAERTTLKRETHFSLLRHLPQLFLILGDKG